MPMPNIIPYHQLLEIVTTMIHSILISFYLFCALASATVSNLTLNAHSPFIREVQTIQHQIDAREIIINLKPSRRCLKPTFRVRLSGKSLYILDLQKVEANSQTFSYPHLVDGGTYFVEVMALLCVTFDPNAFVDTCLEDVADGSNIVTLPYTFEVSVNGTLKATGEPRPRWVLADTASAAILPTRYQKLGCMSEELPFWCTGLPADILQFGLYNWVDRLDYTKLLPDVLVMSRKDEKNKVGIPVGGGIIRVCSIGDSHAREIADHGNKLGLKNVKFIWAITTYPHEFNIGWLKSYQCSYSVLAYGQWPASFLMKNHPYNHDKYLEGMQPVIAALQKYDQNQTQTFLRSVNYNGLGARQTACPPIDFRNPPVIDMYNAVLKRLAKEMGVYYIDMNHIMGPMWDSALDWCHPVGKVAFAEAELVLYHLFRSSLRRKMGVKLYTA